MGCMLIIDERPMLCQPMHTCTPAGCQLGGNQVAAFEATRYHLIVPSLQIDGNADPSHKSKVLYITLRLPYDIGLHFGHLSHMQEVSFGGKDFRLSQLVSAETEVHYYSTVFPQLLVPNGNSSFLTMFGIAYGQTLHF